MEVLSASTELLLATPQPLRLRIIKQTYQGLEKRSDSKSGVVKNIHLVVKKQPFIIEVGQSPDCLSFSLNDFALEAALLFDNLELSEVQTMKVQPMNYKCLLNEEGDKATLEIRLMVLSSQMEDMNFRVSITPIDPISKQRMSECAVISEPIRVVSKPEQARRGTVIPSTPVKKKRTLQNEEEPISEVLSRIEAQVKQQQEMLNKLCEATRLGQMQYTSLMKSIQLTNEEKSRVEPKVEKQDFESAYQTFLNSYNSIEPAERPTKMKRILKCSSNTMVLKEMMAEVTDIIKPGNEITCNCMDCPHKRKLENMEMYFSLVEEQSNDLWQ